MENTYQKIPELPPMAWAEIWRICKDGNDALVKLRNGELQVIEAERKVKFRARCG